MLEALYHAIANPWLQPEQLPVEDFADLPRDMAQVHSWALALNEDHLTLRLDAVRMLLHILKEELRAMQERHSDWISSCSVGTPVHS